MTNLITWKPSVFPGKCRLCDTPLRSKEGLVTKANDGSWVCYCERCRNKIDTGEEKVQSWNEYWQALYKLSMAHGKAHAEAKVPQPMVVVEHSNMADDNSPVKRSWLVSEGVCGFAWVTIRPGNCKFANWLKKNKLARPAYYGGVDIWISDYGQSYERKLAHASVMALVLREAGLNAHHGGRLD